MSNKASQLLLNGLPTLDVRSPSEYGQGRAPGAISFPLFTDEERKDVGIAYKKQGREKAVLLGLKIVGPKLDTYVKEALKIAPERKINMYCWRGGMRSGSLAWLLRTSGFEVNIIEGGYKAWRKEVTEQLSSPHPYINLGGLTGVGKTDVLEELRAQGEQVLDLEGLARHTGSAFNAHTTEQPTTEQFENLAAEELLRMDEKTPIWIEDESRNIGKVFLKNELYDTKAKAPFVLVSRPKEERIKIICDLYGDLPKERLKDSFKKIERRIGGQFLKAALDHIDKGELAEAASIALRYYDRAYTHSMSTHERKVAFTLNLKGLSAAEGAKKLIAWRKEQKIG